MLCQLNTWTMCSQLACLLRWSFGEAIMTLLKSLRLQGRSCSSVKFERRNWFEYHKLIIRYVLQFLEKSPIFLRNLPGISTSARWTAGPGAEYLAPENGGGPLGKRDPYWKPSFLGSMLVWAVWWIILCHVYLLEISFYQKLKGHWFCLTHFLSTSRHVEPLHPVNFWHGNMEIWCHKTMETSGPFSKSLQVVPFWAN